MSLNGDAYITTRPPDPKTLAFYNTVVLSWEEYWKEYRKRRGQLRERQQKLKAEEPERYTTPLAEGKSRRRKSATPPYKDLVTQCTNPQAVTLSPDFGEVTMAVYGSTATSTAPLSPPSTPLNRLQPQSAANAAVVHAEGMKRSGNSHNVDFANTPLTPPPSALKNQTLGLEIEVEGDGKANFEGGMVILEYNPPSPPPPPSTPPPAAERRMSEVYVEFGGLDYAEDEDEDKENIEEEVVPSLEWSGDLCDHGTEKERLRQKREIRKQRKEMVAYVKSLRKSRPRVLQLINEA